MFIRIKQGGWVNSDKVVAMQSTGNGLVLLLEDGSSIPAEISIDEFLQQTNAKETLADLLNAGQEVRL